jgi:hypothetical protein
MSFQAIIHAVSNIPIDWLVIVAVIVLAIVSTMMWGTGKATALSLAFPFAALLYSEVPDAFILGDALGKLTAPLTQTIVFAVILTIALFALFRITTSFDMLSRGLLLGVFSGIALVILLIVTWLQVPALESLYPLSNPLPAVFAVAYRFWWTLAALSILAFVRS